MSKVRLRARIRMDPFDPEVRVLVRARTMARARLGPGWAWVSKGGAEE